MVTDIPDDGFGTVRVHLGGHTLRFNARADGALDAGTARARDRRAVPDRGQRRSVWSALPPAD